jgi:hypothetical protein
VSDSSERRSHTSPHADIHNLEPPFKILKFAARQAFWFEKYHCHVIGRFAEARYRRAAGIAAAIPAEISVPA